MSRSILRKIDRERQRSHIGLEIGVHMRMCVCKSRHGGVHAGCGENSIREARRQCGLVARGYVQYFALGTQASTFCMSPAADGSMLLDSGIGLPQENLLDDRLDAGLLADEITFRVAAGNAEHTCQQ